MTCAGVRMYANPGTRARVCLCVCVLWKRRTRSSTYIIDRIGCARFSRMLSRWVGLHFMSAAVYAWRGMDNGRIADVRLTGVGVELVSKRKTLSRSKFAYQIFHRWYGLNGELVLVIRRLGDKQRHVCECVCLCMVCISPVQLHKLFMNQTCVSNICTRSNCFVE